MARETLVVAGITDPGTLACIARARTYKQYCSMVEDALANRCPFCTLDPEKNVVIVDSNFFHAWQSPYPEKNTRHHFILAPKRHVMDTMELSADEKLDMFFVMANLQRKYGYKSRGILIRDGDATLSAGTLQHLHVHVMVPDGTGRVESPFYKGASEELIGVKTAILFERMRQGAVLTDLSGDEYRLIEGRVR